MIYAYEVNNGHSSTLWSTQDFTHSQQSWCCPEGPVVQCQCSIHCTKHTIHNINGTIGFDLEWPTATNDVRPIVTIPLSKFLYNTLLTIKLTCIVSSWPLLSHIPVYHVIRYKLSCLYFTCMSFYKSHLVNMFSTTFFLKWQSSCAINTNRWVVKFACFSIYKIDV